MADNRSLKLRISTVDKIIKKLESLKMPLLYPAFAPVLKSLDKRIVKAKSLPVKRIFGGKSKVKESIKQQLAKAAYHVSCVVYSYAQITRNEAMKNAVQYSYSDFYRAKEDTMIGRVRQMINALKKIKNPEHFGLTPKVIDEINFRFNHFMDFKNVPKVEVKKHAQALRHADKLLDECFEIIQHQLDPLVVAVSQNENILARDYKDVRKIEKGSGRRRKYIKKNKATVENEKTIIPVAHSATPVLHFADLQNAKQAQPV